MFAFFFVNRLQTQRLPKIVLKGTPQTPNMSKTRQPTIIVFLDADSDVILYPNGAQTDPQSQPDGTPGPPCGVQDDVNMPKMPPQAICGPNMV